MNIETKQEELKTFNVQFVNSYQQLIDKKNKLEEKIKKASNSAEK